jgi:hypothetical protein
MLDHLAVQNAELMMEDWLAKNAAKAPMPDVLTTARRLAADHAPPALRVAFDRIIAGEAELYPERPG